MRIQGFIRRLGPITVLAALSIAAGSGLSCGYKTGQAEPHHVPR